MSDTADQIVQKLWNYCSVLRDDGLSYQDYIEQLTFLLFLKMADEQTKPPFNREAIVPAGLDWASLVALDGMKLEAQYLEILAKLGELPGTLGVVFKKAQNKIQDPAKLRRLIVDLIGAENWMSLSADVKGDAYEGLLAKNAEDVKTGAGQYFTPRVLIAAIVEVMRPEPDQRICDPAAGTGGFLLAAFKLNYMSGITRRDGRGPEEAPPGRGTSWMGDRPGVGQMCAMNMLLHGISGERRPTLSTVVDSLRPAPSTNLEMVLTNPPFGRKASFTS